MAADFVSGTTEGGSAGETVTDGAYDVEDNPADSSLVQAICERRLAPNPKAEQKTAKGRPVYARWLLTVRAEVGIFAMALVADLVRVHRLTFTVVA